ncbi:MAG: hypothetical protein LBS32_04815 [Clostridiales Family XIII bacterium]|jgi:hypothetical protein|nr:hypothetical protein [Clostridiales Family XIII bacterium]
MSNVRDELPLLELPHDNSKTQLVERLIAAIHAVPFYFDSTTVIEGVEAGDLFSLNTVLGSTIEVQTVSVLNKLRNIWDPNSELSNYAFRRSSQSFPDVRLVNTLSLEAEPLFGIELKGWYVLTKEKAPTFRYRVTPDACSEFDLLVVIPWHLSNVLSGKPVICEPFVINAKYAAMARNHYWVNMRETTLDTAIVSPENVFPYPRASAEISDKPKNDSGGNFGRIARVNGLMDDFISSTLRNSIAGIPAIYWIDFFITFIDNHTRESIEQDIKTKLARISNECGNSTEIEKTIEALADSILKLFWIAKNDE